MARTDNLTNFLTDVAAAIKRKKGSQTAIPAANFDSEIMSISGGSGDIKLFDTVAHMQADASAIVGDLAVVYRNQTQPITETTQFSSCTFPSTVTLPSATSGTIRAYFEKVSGSGYFEGNARLTSSQFRFTGYTDEDEIHITYTSQDGTTYTRTDGGDETVDFGMTIAFNDGMYDWNDAIGYFMLSGGMYFEGLYEYGNVTDQNYVQFIPMTSISFDLVSNPGTTIRTVTNFNYSGVKLGQPISIDRIKTLYTSIRTELFGQYDYPYIQFFLNNSDELCVSVPAVGDNRRFVADPDFRPLGFASSSGSDAISEKIYKINNDDTLTLVESLYGTTYGDYYYVPYTNIKSVPFYVFNQGSTWIIGTWIVLEEANNNGVVLTSSLQEKFSWYPYYNHDTYCIASTQFNIDTSDVFTGKIGLGKTGLVTGDGTYINNIPNTDFIDRFIGDNYQSETLDYIKEGSAIPNKTFMEKIRCKNVDSVTANDYIKCTTSSSSTTFDWSSDEFFNTEWTYMNSYSVFIDEKYYLVTVGFVGSDRNDGYGYGTISKIGTLVLDLTNKNIALSYTSSCNFHPINHGSSDPNEVRGTVKSAGYDFTTNKVYILWASDWIQGTKLSYGITTITSNSYTHNNYDFPVSENWWMIRPSSWSVYLNCFVVGICQYNKSTSDPFKVYSIQPNGTYTNNLTVDLNTRQILLSVGHQTLPIVILRKKSGSTYTGYEYYNLYTSSYITIDGNDIGENDYVRCFKGLIYNDLKLYFGYDSNSSTYTIYTVDVKTNTYQVIKTGFPSYYATINFVVYNGVLCIAYYDNPNFGLLNLDGTEIQEAQFCRDYVIMDQYGTYYTVVDSQDSEYDFITSLGFNNIYNNQCGYTTKSIKSYVLRPITSLPVSNEVVLCYSSYTNPSGSMTSFSDIPMNQCDITTFDVPDFPEELNCSIYGSTDTIMVDLPSMNGLDWNSASCSFKTRVKLHNENIWRYTSWINEEEDECYTPAVYSDSESSSYIYYDEELDEYALSFIVDTQNGPVYLTEDDQVELIVDLVTLDGKVFHKIIPVILFEPTSVFFGITFTDENGDYFEEALLTPPTATLDGTSITVRDGTNKGRSYFVQQDVSTNNAILSVSYNNTTTTLTLPVDALLEQHSYVYWTDLQLDGTAHTLWS